MSKLPAFQFYPGDWQKDPGVQSLTLEQKGFWFELLLLMHESEQRGKLLLNGKPMPHAAIALNLGIPVESVQKMTEVLIDYGVTKIDPGTGALTCRRMVRDEGIIQKRVSCGKMGGNPNFRPGEKNPYYQKDNPHNQKISKHISKTVDGKDNQADNQKITPSSSSSSSTTVIKESKKKARTQLPDNFEPTQNHQDFAHQNNLQIGAELSKFRFHHEERVTLSGNWNSSFSKWLSNAIEFRKPKKQNGSGRVQDAKLDVVEQIMGGLHHETKRQTRDITPGRTIESNGARIPETPFSLRKPDAS